MKIGSQEMGVNRKGQRASSVLGWLPQELHQAKKGVWQGFDTKRRWCYSQPVQTNMR